MRTYAAVLVVFSLPCCLPDPCNPLGVDAPDSLLGSGLSDADVAVLIESFDRTPQISW